MTQEYFPGSRQVIRPPAGVPDPVNIPEGFGRTFNIAGQEMTLYGIGELAELLNRRPVTLRLWERKGILPKATYVRPGANKDPRGRRRYYSKEQVMALIQIARDEKILDDLNAHVTKTQFQVKALHAFREIARNR